MNSNLKESVVLIVDDTPDNIKLMSTILRDKYKIKAVNQGSKACRAAQTLPRPDLILLDILMPHVNGYDVCRQLKKSPDTKDIPVIFLTSLTDMEDEKLGLELGAADYITKPVSPPILLERVKNHLKLKEASDFLKDKNLYLESEVKRRTEQMLFTQNASLIALASLAETRDNETGNHLRRTQLYIESLIKELLRAGRYEKELTPQYIDMTIQSAPVHDIGKVGIPDRILLKPGRLDEQEFRIMKTHSLLGYRAIENAEDDVGEMIGYLTVAKEITLGHHEKWDGSGYPYGKGEEEIPLSARLMAVADVYDALVSKRVYKEKIPEKETVEILVEGRGKHFDPMLIDAFLRCRTDFSRIHREFREPLAHGV